jgi:hypothetical protein
LAKINHVKKEGLKDPLARDVFAFFDFFAKKLKKTHTSLAADPAYGEQIL